MTHPDDSSPFDWPADSTWDRACIEIDDRDFPRSVARCFSSPDGRRILRHLRAITLDRCLGPSASDSMLRHLEGQRSLVRYLISLKARGLGHDGVEDPQASVTSNAPHDPADV